ncbi:hypothetical protein LTR64_000099 [Lithohypha guttulata]|uniref:uncharacterized protein n=1 Tax=Lithohypha guttulata TaxID=1690604 RepID=UPI002DE1D9B0|nr:hypothetical protein LTR51_007461 [Lithohypha guttulata]
MFLQEAQMATQPQHTMSKRSKLQMLQPQSSPAAAKAKTPSTDKHPGPTEYPHLPNNTTTITTTPSPFETHFHTSETYLSHFNTKSRTDPFSTFTPYNHSLHPHRPAYNVQAIGNWKLDLKQTGGVGLVEGEYMAQMAHLRGSGVLAEIREELEELRPERQSGGFVKTSRRGGIGRMYGVNAFHRIEVEQEEEEGDGYCR